jgi:hypothetical protein
MEQVIHPPSSAVRVEPPVTEAFTLTKPSISRIAFGVFFGNLLTGVVCFLVWVAVMTALGRI